MKHIFRTNTIINILCAVGITTMLLLWQQGAALAGPPDPGAAIPVVLSDAGVIAGDETVWTEAGVTTITTAGAYALTGSLTDGRVVVETEDQGVVRLILDTVDIASTTGAPIQIMEADEVVLVLPDGSASLLARSRAVPGPDPTPGGPRPVADETPGVEPGAAIESIADLTITGTGSLAVTSDGHDGITSDDGLVIDSGSIVVDAAGDGLRGEDFVLVNTGTIAVNAGGAGLTATNDANPAMGSIRIRGGSITVGSGDDAVKACGAVAIEGGTLSLSSSIVNEGDGIHSDTRLDVLSGHITVVEAYEGLEALKLTIRGGTVSVTTSDDGLNASENGVDDHVIAPNAFIHLEGGTITVEAGDDGIDSNGTIAVTGGETVVSAAYDGIDANGSFTITGGSVVVNGAPVNDNFQDGLEVLGGLIFSGGTLLSAAIAASYTPPAPASAQGWISIKLGASQPAGTIVQLAAHPTEPSADATVTVLAAYQAGKAFRSMLFTSSAITNGQTYDVYTGGSVSGRNIGGLYAAGDLTGATKVATVEAGRFTR